MGTVAAESTIIKPNPPGSSPHVSEGGVKTDINLDDIQGNIFGGFSKDHQVNIFFAITDGESAKKTLGPTDEDDPAYPMSIFGHVAHSGSSAVIAFNEQFKALRRAGIPEGTILATWTNLVLTSDGMTALEVGLTDFPKAFVEGMRNRAHHIGDLDIDKEGKDIFNGPAHWNDDMDVSIAWEEVDGLIMVAADDPAAMNARVADYLVKLNATGSGTTVLGVIHGETRVDQPGHEHFGFKDGVSQPGIRGVDAPDDALHQPDQGNPNQDLLHPGEFVLGYPTQIPAAEKTDDGNFDGPNRIPGPNSGETLPDWAKNGSFLVFRRLAQDVQGFRDAVDSTAKSLGITSDLLGAKIVGRFRSGAPLEALKFQAGTGSYVVPVIDPGIANPALADSDALNNDFEYGEDADGKIVPKSAHIRKAYPRDQVPSQEAGLPLPPDIGEPGVAESRTQTHRLLRRGIPFGKSLGTDGDGGLPGSARGLLFFAYQKDIQSQFEFVQGAWVNDGNFPENGAGEDPIITNKSSEGAISGCPFHAKANKSKCPVRFTHFVKTRGGGYFFSPSISTLSTWLDLKVKMAGA